MSGELLRLVCVWLAFFLSVSLKGQCKEKRCTAGALHQGCYLEEGGHSNKT